MIRQTFLLALSAFLLSTASVSAAGISYPEAPGPSPDKLISPPEENPYFYIRADKQAFSLQVDSTNNFTDYFNRHYYDYAWRGEQWSPWGACTIPEKLIRSCHLWPEFNEANQYHLFNGVNKFFERFSGYGPGPGKGGVP